MNINNNFINNFCRLNEVVVVVDKVVDEVVMLFVVVIDLVLVNEVVVFVIKLLLL